MAYELQLAHPWFKATSGLDLAFCMDIIFSEIAIIFHFILVLSEPDLTRITYPLSRVPSPMLGSH